MGRRPTKIKVDLTWETSDDPNAILPWVRATELLLRAKERPDAYLARLETEAPALFLVESLVSFARRQEDAVLHSGSGVPYRVEVPLDMMRLGKGLLFILVTTERARTEPLTALTSVAERYLLTHSLDPADYREVTSNAPLTLALLSQHLAESKPS